MATEKRFATNGDVVYVIGKYRFSPDERPKVVEARVAYCYRKQLYTYPTGNHGTFKFSNRDMGKSVFFSQEEAEAALAKMDGA